MTDARPYCPPLALVVGVTGHRQLTAGDAARARSALERLFADLRAGVDEVCHAHSDLFADTPARMALLSPLAMGADQIAAEVALEAGIELRAVLPFDRAHYARDFDEDGRARLDALIARASASWSLPGGDSGGAYVGAGAATVAGSDILVAVWDGEPARGPGGTADVVEIAVRRGVPVIHLPLAADRPPAIIWPGWARLPGGLMRGEDAPRRPLDPVTLRELVDRLIAPPSGTERAALIAYLGEREQRNRLRPEWALLLWLTRVRPLGRRAFRALPYLAEAAVDWRPFRDSVARACAYAPTSNLLESTFAWSDGLARHYADLYRSGTVFNFAAAALAVILSLAAALVPGQKLLLLVVELLVIGALILNTIVGTRRGWHRRWLDYRFLAEQLRPMRGLRLFSTAMPRFATRAGNRRWTDWYAAAVWRAMETPPTIADGTALAGLAELVAHHEIDSQVAYHHQVAHRMHRLDHRLHVVGLTLFLATIAVGLATLVGLTFKIGVIKSLAPLLGMLSAALPTAGAAIFGIRGAGDFAGIAGRSEETADRLAHAAAHLRQPDVTLAEAARATEDAAGTMLAELDEWRAAYRTRKLAIPS